MVFRVEIDKWLRGNERKSLLLNSSGQMCCLGFAERQCGATPAYIRGVARPEHLPVADQPARAVGLLVNDRGFNTPFSDRAMRINDDPGITDTERMKRLRALAKKHGHRFVFVRGKKK